MLIRYSCKDMGLKCSYVIKGETQEEVTKRALDHVREKHSHEFNSVNSLEEIEQMERALTRSTRVVPG
jgi:predicted small metal-binding protein